MEYFRIKNWEKYQHHDHKKTMPWFRAYANILNDPEFMSLKEGCRLAWLLLLHYCCTTANKLPYSKTLLRARLGLKRCPDLALFEDMGWIEKISTVSRPVDDRATNGLDKIREKNGVDSITPSIKGVSKNRRLTPQEIEHQKRESLRRFGSAQGAPDGPTAAQVGMKNE